MAHNCWHAAAPSFEVIVMPLSSLLFLVVAMFINFVSAGNAVQTILLCHKCIAWFHWNIDTEEWFCGNAGNMPKGCIFVLSYQDGTLLWCHWVDLPFVFALISVQKSMMIAFISLQDLAIPYHTLLSTESWYLNIWFEVAAAVHRMCIVCTWMPVLTLNA